MAVRASQAPPTPPAAQLHPEAFEVGGVPRAVYEEGMRMLLIAPPAKWMQPGSAPGKEAQPC